MLLFNVVNTFLLLGLLSIKKNDAKTERTDGDGS